MKKIDFYSIILGLLIGAAASGWILVAYVEHHPKYIHAWHRTLEDSPPNNGEPFYGVWIRSGKLEQSFSRRIDNRYFTYKPGVMNEASALLGYIAPEWWMEIPESVQ